ncbi:MAG: hypothetical protein HQL30_03460 [Candidatus Omnitrophica bacterium]|nr:hypothetical protein [Candidatus Omnitrophota bacterium]
MAKDYQDIIDDVIFNAGQIAMKMRLNKSMGQLYAALYFSENPVSLDELAKKCRMSKGNASINIRHLERWNAVTKTFSNGSRKDYYVANSNIMGFVMTRGKEIFASILNRGEALVSRSLNKISSVDISKMDEVQQSEIRKHRTKIEEMDKMLTKMKGLTNNLQLLEQFLK